MLKGLMIVLFVLALALYSATRSGQHPDDQQATPSHPPTEPSGALATQQNTPQHERAEGHEKRYLVDKLLAWPEGITALAIILTLGAIVWQSDEARKGARASENAARAALMQSEHIIASERAWIVVQVENERIPQEIQGDTGDKWTSFEIRIVNHGKTPAYLIESGHQGVILSHSESLPDRPGPYKDRGVKKAITKWEGEGLPLQPNADIRMPFWGTFCKDAGKLQRGFDVLWVYGYVIYSDTFQKRRETHYCVRWNSGVGTDHGSSWVQGGPPVYNRAT